MMTNFSLSLSLFFSSVSLILRVKKIRKSSFIIPKLMVVSNFEPVMKSNFTLNTIRKVENLVRVNYVESSKEKDEILTKFINVSSLVIFNDLID